MLLIPVSRLACLSLRKLRIGLLIGFRWSVSADRKAGISILERWLVLGSRNAWSDCEDRRKSPCETHIVIKCFSIPHESMFVLPRKILDGFLMLPNHRKSPILNFSPAAVVMGRHVGRTTFCTAKWSSCLFVSRTWLVLLTANSRWIVFVSKKKTYTRLPAAAWLYIFTKAKCDG